MPIFRLRFANIVLATIGATSISGHAFIRYGFVDRQSGLKVLIQSPSPVLIVREA